LYFSKLKTNC